MQTAVLPIFLFVACIVVLCIGLLVLGNLVNPGRHSRVKQMPYESGMDPIHDTRRQFSVRFHLVAIAFLVFDVELLFLYPWAVTARPARQTVSRETARDEAAGQMSQGQGTQVPPANVAPTALQRSPAWQQFIDQRRLIFAGVIVFLALLTLGFIYDWRKGIFQWR